MNAELINNLVLLVCLKSIGIKVSEDKLEIKVGYISYLTLLREALPSCPLVLSILSSIFEKNRLTLVYRDLSV